MITLPPLTPPASYAGIGSRETPADVSMLMQRIAFELAKLDWCLRSGAAPGADTAFEEGASSLTGARREIFLPWPGFQGHRGPHWTEPTREAAAIAARFHPSWSRLSRGAQALQARNTHQVLGRCCDDPSKFVLCWTKDGATEKTSSWTGGTGQAIRIAAAYNVPVYNLQRHDVRRAWEEWAGVKREPESLWERMGV